MAVIRFPRTQAEMTEWKSKYYWDPTTKKWYDTKPPQTESNQSGIADIQKKISQIQQQIQTRKDILQDVQSRGLKPNEPIPADILAKYSSFVPDFSNLPPKDTKDIDKGYVNAKSALDLANRQWNQYEQEKQQLSQTLEAQGARGSTLWEKMISLVKQKPQSDIQGARQQLEQQYQIPDWLKKVQQQSIKVAQIKGDIEQLETQRTAAIDRAYAMPMQMGAIEAKVNALNREYNIKKAYKVADLSANAALLQAYSGNLDTARQLANDAVDAYLYDIKQQREDFDAVLNIYGDWFNSLDKEQQRIIEETRKRVVEEEERLRKEKTQVMELALKYPNAGIKVDDTLEEAVKEAKEWERLHPEEQKTSATEGKSKVLEETYQRLLQSKGGGYGVWTNEYGNQYSGYKPGSEYVNLQTYLDERARSTISSSDFDKRFGNLLSPADQQKIGITKPQKPNKWEKEETVWKWLATEEARKMSDAEKAVQIKSYGLNPEDFGIYE